MAKRYSADQWAVWAAEQRESALSVRDFRDWIAVSQNAIYLWPRKLAVAPSQKPGTSKKFPPGARFASSVRRFSIAVCSADGSMQSRDRS